MGLDNATVKEFANLINPFDKTSGEATVYGRVVGFNEVGGRPIVNLDGSTQNIPIRTTVKVKGPKGNPGDQDYYAGDRVLVRIKNHEALIVSNISTQMTTAEGAEDAAKQYVSDNGFIYAEKISGEQGDFYTLSADKFNATQITGALGHFITVNADRIITDAINAQIANIDTIKASDVVAGEGDFAYLNVDNVLDAKLARLDTANINRANVNSLFVSGFAIATDATIVNGHITGYLDSVEINANKITAGTLLVDRLYIKDQNNKWKMQTVDDQGHTVYVEAADRINERTITADKLVAHSITTDELNVSNLTAGDSVFMTALTNTLEAEEIFVSYEEADSIIAGKIAADLAELDILNINEELKTQNIHLGEIVFDQPSKPSVMSGNPDYILGIERETKTISAYDDTSLYSEGDYVTHYYSKDNINTYPYGQTTRTTNGITFTDNGDGTITANGTATANATFSVHARFGTSTHNNEKNKLVLPNGTYILSGSPEGSLTSTYYMDVGRTVNSAFKRIGRATSDPLTFTANGDDSSADEIKPTINIVVLDGQTVNNVIFEPKIRLATNEDATWYPFVKGVYKCIKPISTAELWDENKWYYLRDAVSGDQYEFDHVRYTNKINRLYIDKLLRINDGPIEIKSEITDRACQVVDSDILGHPTGDSSSDPYFTTGLNGAIAYNNKGNGKVSISRVPRSSDNPTSSNYEMQIAVNGELDTTITPGYGGFYFGNTGTEGQVIRYTIIAKFSSAYDLAFASNAMGSDFSAEWLTPTQGRDKFEKYVFQMQYGSGTLSSTGFFYLKAPHLPSGAVGNFTWRVAMADYMFVNGYEFHSGKDNIFNILKPIGSLHFSEHVWKSNNAKPPLVIDYSQNPNNLYGGIWVRRMGHNGESSTPISMHGYYQSDSTTDTHTGYTGTNSKSISAHSVSASITNAATTLNYNQSGLRSHNHRQYHHCAGGNCSDNLASGDTYASSFNWNPTNWSFCPDTGNWNAASSHSHANSISVSVGAHSNINVQQETYTVKVWCRIM